ncbi:CD209 antigen-like protein E [Protopterus annectens]|uniref:CD209 antigen-like protein E n=1 Tax=Protopterus annectens TaxID=7888 RepID=UPI001CF986C5|nr:CD209 antigen-like protein E [Protopterus annectens]
MENNLYENTYCGTELKQAKKLQAEILQTNEKVTTESNNTSNTSKVKLIALMCIITLLGISIVMTILYLQKSKQLEQANLLQNSSIGFEKELIQPEVKAANLPRDQISLQMQLKQAQWEIEQFNSRLQGKCCPPGWDFLSPSCYYFTTSSENWFNAQTHCASLSSDLVVIKGAEEQEFINKRKIHDQLYWIGLTDNEVESTWKWVDGSLCSSSSDGTVYWYKSQPNGQPLDEDCAVIYLDGSWHDFPCDSKFAWICERPAYTCFS